jgi:hypothetical protein
VGLCSLIITIAASLSINSGIGCSCVQLSSRRMDHRYLATFAALTLATNAASVDDVAMVV